jgi:hypothetical protein
MLRIVSIFIICLVCSFGFTASAAVDQQAIASAAQASAAERLAADISAESINSTITVKAFLDRTGSTATFLAVLGRARPIGGSRWIDYQTCQVQLDIPGPEVRADLRQIALDNPTTTPLLPNQVSTSLASWGTRVFSATGSGTGGIDGIRPPADSAPWHDATDAEIHDSVAAARQDAVNKILASIGSVPLGGSKNISDALAIPAIHQSISDWLMNRPITLVDFRDDHQVEITLFVTAADLSDQLCRQLAGRTDIGFSAKDKAWTITADEISKQMSPPVGRSAVVDIANSTTQPDTLPDEPPPWIYNQLDASGNGTGQTQLLATSAAETAATQNLRRQIMQLSISPGKNLQDLAAHDPRYAAAIDRTLASRAHVYSIEYLTDGSASVRMSLDLRDLWDMLWTAR